MKALRIVVAQAGILAFVAALALSASCSASGDSPCAPGTTFDGSQCIPLCSGGTVFENGQCHLVAEDATTPDSGDQIQPTDGDADEPAHTTCKFPVAVSNATGKGYGESCTTSAECEYGACILPGATGNITNTKFGFCTRACDCNNDENAKIPVDEKEQLECIYPSTPDQQYRHVVIQCTNVAQCQAISPEWTACQNPGIGVANVCTAL